MQLYLMYLYEDYLCMQHTGKILLNLANFTRNFFLVMGKTNHEHYIPYQNSLFKEKQLSNILQYIQLHISLYL